MWANSPAQLAITYFTDRRSDCPYWPGGVARSAGVVVQDPKEIAYSKISQAEVPEEKVEVIHLRTEFTNMEHYE